MSNSISVSHRPQSNHPSRRFTHGQMLSIELLPSVIDGLKACAEKNNSSLFHEIRCAIYQYLDRELPPIHLAHYSPSEDGRATPEQI